MRPSSLLALLLSLSSAAAPRAATTSPPAADGLRASTPTSASRPRRTVRRTARPAHATLRRGATRTPAPAPAPPPPPAPRPAPDDGPLRGYLRQPAVQGDRVVFTAEDDLWWAPLAGGQAHRLTDAPGRESLAHVSADGRWIAYTSTADGNEEVYVIGRDGGTPRRLTVHPSPDEVLGWAPDGGVVFRSRRIGAHGVWYVFEVPRDGGEARQIPVDAAALLTWAPDGDRVAFTVHSQETRTWKRYTGGWSQDIWAGSLSQRQYAKLTTYPGNDAFPMAYGDRIAFLSDRDGTANVWSMRWDGSDLRQHTRHEDFDARWASIEPGGSRVVYMLGGDLWTIDVVTESSPHRIEVRLPTDASGARERIADPADYVSAAALSRDGYRVAVTARGEIASVPLKEGRTIDLTRGNSGANERDAAWSPDGRQVVFVSDQGGEEAAWLVPSDGSEPPRRLTTPSTARMFAPSWSPDGRRIAWSDSDLALHVADARTGESSVAARSDAGEILEMAWSPDGRFLAYARPITEDTTALEIWDSRTGSVHSISSAWASDFSPAWDPAGRYLYFLGNRTWDPVVGQVDFESVFDRMTRPYAVVLRAGQPGPFFPRDEAVRKAEEEAADAAAGGGDDDEDTGGDAKPKGASSRKHAKTAPEPADKAPKPAAPVVIDFDGLAERVVPFPVDVGNLDDLRATPKAVLWLDEPTSGLLEGGDIDEEPPPTAVLKAWTFEDGKLLTVQEPVAGYDVAADGSRVAWMDEDGLKWREGLEAGDEGDHDVDLAHWHLAVDRRAEWAQIFDEAWRLEREFYWEPGMAGIDWKEVRDRYRALLPRLGTRDDLNDLVGQMIAELSTSHTYVWGGDLDAPDPQGIGLLGLETAPDAACDCRRITRVYPGRTWEARSASPARLPQAGLHAGDFLLAIDGRRLGAGDDPLADLEGLAGEIVALTVSDQGSRTDGHARTIEVRTVADDSRLRYLDWVESRRRMVTELSGGRLGYLHVPDMGGEGLSAFSQDFYPQIGKEGLVVDVRYNGGGFVSQLILARLRRQLMAYDRPRRGQLETYPYRVFTGPLAVLINGMTGSDGDIFANAFQLAKLGPVIGTRSWGGVIGIRADKPLVDGGMVTQPEFAWLEAERGWTVENQGVTPDIPLENDPSLVVRGRDPQLEKAVEVLMAKLPAERAPQPTAAAPDKSKRRFREAQRPYLTRP